MRRTSSCGLNLQFEHHVERRAAIGQQLVERLSLLHIARESVEQTALLQTRVIQALVDNLEHEFIGHQFAGLHVTLRLLAKLRPLTDRLAEHVAGRHVGDAKQFHESLGLGTLAGTGRTDKDNEHGWQYSYPVPDQSSRAVTERGCGTPA